MAALLLALTITGCDDAKTPQTDDTGSSEIVTLSDAEALSVADFCVLRSDSSEEAVTAAAVRLKNSINETVTGASIGLSTDWVKRGDTIPTDTAEIIVGDSNRRAQTGLRRDDYQIIREGNRIYILGGSGEAVASAVEACIDNYLSAGGLTIPDKTDVTACGTYVIEALSFGSETVSELKYFADSLSPKTTAFDALVSRLSDVTGLPAERADAVDEANIVLTTKSNAVKEGDWGVSAENGRLVLVGRTELECRSACSYINDLIADAEQSKSLALEPGTKSEHQTTKEEYYKMNQLVIYPEFPEAIKRDYAYSVSVTQNDRTETLPVYNHTMESSVSRGTNGADEYRRFSMFAFSGDEVRVDVEVKQDFKSYSVMPSAKSFRSEYKDGVISVWLDKPDYFLVRLDDDNSTIISVFADYPEFPDEIDESDPNLIKIEGWVEPEGGILELKEPDTTLYITPGSVLNARVRVTGEGSKVIGHGAIVDPFENIYEYDIREGGTEGHGFNLLNISGNNMTLDGPILLDARCFNITVGGNDHVIRNMKVMSTMMTSDGISIYWGKNALAEHCFVYCGDNTMVFSAENTIYRDITCGTTCAAIFPQGNPKNTLLEDIHIFRTDDGAINHLYNGKKDQLTADVKINNIDSADCVYMPWFFYGRNMGEAEKVFDIRNVSLGDTTEQKTTKIFRFLNGSNYVQTDNYDLKLTNIAIDGKPVSSFDEMTLSVEGDPKFTGNKYAYGAEAGFEPVTKNSTTVDYKAAGKVYIGTEQIFFEHPVLTDGGFMLPAAQTMSELRTDKCAAKTEIGGTAYVKASELVSSGMAKAAEERDGALYITPNYNGENLFLADSGEISSFTESTCYELDLVTSKEGSETVYTVYNTKKTLNSGIQRIIAEEARKYGAGTYRVTFEGKASEEGKLRMLMFFKNAKSIEKTAAVGADWSKFTFEFTLTDEHLSDRVIAFAIKSGGTALNEFAVKNLELCKIS